jgi:hypothetical protein
MADISDPSWSETDGSNTGAPPTGWPANMPPNQVEPTARAMMGAKKRFWNRVNPTITTTGSTAVYTWAASFGPTALVQGEIYAFKAHQASVGGDTFNPNGLGAKPIYRQAAAGPIPITPGAIQNGEMVVVAYDGALGGTGAFQILSDLSGASVNSIVLQANAISLRMRLQLT